MQRIVYQPPVFSGANVAAAAGRGASDGRGTDDIDTGAGATGVVADALVTATVSPSGLLLPGTSDRGLSA